MFLLKMVLKVFVLSFLVLALYFLYGTADDVYPKNCKEIQKQGHEKSDVYLIQPELSSKPFKVFCDMETRGGGWAYLLHRFNGSQNFYLNWQNYKDGFGDLRGEFWLGLDNMHYITASQNNELLIELGDWDLNETYALYKSFKVGNESGGYVLSVSNYSGSAGDSFSYLSGRKFSTKDKDQDKFVFNCAEKYRAAWWYNQCAVGQLTGEYKKQCTKNATPSLCLKGIYWKSFRGLCYNLKEAKMMVRPF